MHNYRVVEYVEKDLALKHHGILGMKWGIRRYQNKDGSLTPEGRERLGLNNKTKTKDRFGDDIVIKKGTKATRVIKTRWHSDWHLLSDEEKKRDIKELFDVEDKLIEKYISVDENKNGGSNGTEYYLSWFTDDGLSPKGVYVDKIKVNKDLKIASGQKVLDALLKETGDMSMDEVKRGVALKTLTMKYTTDKELRNRINKDLMNMGYDGVKDINDLDTDLPLIIFNANNYLKTEQRISAEDYKREASK